MPLRPSSIRNNPEKCNIFDDFDNILYDNECWAYRTNGGTVATPASPYAGQIALTCGSHASQKRWVELYIGCMSFSVAKNMWLQVRANISATTKVNLEFGFCAITPDNQDNRIFWCASTVLGTTWMGRTSSGGTLSTVDSGVAFDTNWHEFWIVTSSGSVTFFMDGVAYAPLTTNISSSLMSPYMRATNDGANIRTLTIDVVEAIGDRD